LEQAIVSPEKRQDVFLRVLPASVEEAHICSSNFSEFQELIFFIFLLPSFPPSKLAGRTSCRILSRQANKNLNYLAKPI
jgi:hypothetical protein